MTSGDMTSSEDDALREYLRRRADAGEVDPEFRERVRSRLDAAQAEAVPPPRRRWDRMLVAASVIALFGALSAALVWSSQQERSPALGQTGTTEPPAPGPVPIDSVMAGPAGDGRRIESRVLRTPLYFDVPRDDDKIVAIASTPEALEVSLAGPTDASPPEVPMVRILAPSSEATADVIEAGLAGPHIDSVVTEIGSDELGGRATRVVRLESDAGTTAVGFEIGSDVYVAANGIDRRYEAHIMETARGVLVIWIDASEADFDAAREDAAAIVASLRLIGS